MLTQKRSRKAAVLKPLHKTAGVIDSVRLGALGPEGTSSEAVATDTADVLFPCYPVYLSLFDSFDQLRDALHDQDVDYGLVPAAYKGANKFYFDSRLKRVSSFVHPTPPYGLAVHPDRPLGQPSVLATHSAPVPLVEHFPVLLPTIDWSAVEIREVSSTSVAARMVAEGTAELAITNANAAELYGLTFMLDFGPIIMDWTLFARLPTV